MRQDDHLVRRFGSARYPERATAHPRPPGASDRTVEALGKLSEALEAVEDARGHLYAFHRLSGRADLILQEAVVLLRDAGERSLAAEVDEVLVGRDVVNDMWTFQIVEAYDNQYWSVFRGVEAEARRRVRSAEPHVFEAEMKQREQERGTPAQ